MLVLVEGTGKNQLEPGQSLWDVVTLFFAKKSLTNTDWCSGAWGKVKLASLTPGKDNEV